MLRGLESQKSAGWTLPISAQTMELGKMTQEQLKKALTQMRQMDYLSLLANRVIELQQMNDKLETKINELLQDINDLLSETHPLEDK